MTTTVPPAHSNVAASLDWETATVDDAWALSDATGIPARAILGTPHQLVGGDTQL